MKRSLAAVGVCSVLLGAACSAKPVEQQETSTSIAPARPARKAVAAKRDPCSLVTAAEMTAALAVGVVAKADGNTCGYQGQNPAADGGAQIDVSWENDNNGRAMLEAMRQTGKVEIVPGAEPETLAGLGDGATYSTFTLYVLKGDTLLTFRIQPAPAHFMDLLKKGGPPQEASATLSSEILAKEKVLAGKALARL